MTSKYEDNLSEKSREATDKEIEAARKMLQNKSTKKK